MDEIRAGIVGLGGFFEATHLPCMRRVAGLRIVAGCDLREDRRRQARQLLGDGVKLYADLDGLLADGRVNAVYVLTQPEAMRPIVLEVAQARLPVFCEKPPGHSCEDTRAMAQAADAAGITQQVAFNRRFGPFTERLRQWLAEAGRPTRIESVFRRVFSRAPLAVTGSGIHALDLVISLMGPVRRVMGARSVQRPGQGFCHFHAAFEFASGACGAFLYDNRMALPAEEYHLSCVSPDTLTAVQLSLVFPPPTKVRSTGKSSRTKLTYRSWGEGGAVLDAEREEFVRADLTGEDELLVGAGYLAEHEAFADALRQGKPAHPTFGETVHSMEVAETIQAGGYREFGA